MLAALSVSVPLPTLLSVPAPEMTPAMLLSVLLPRLSVAYRTMLLLALPVRLPMLWSRAISRVVALPSVTAEASAMARLPPSASSRKVPPCTWVAPL